MIPAWIQLFAALTFLLIPKGPNLNKTEGGEGELMFYYAGEEELKTIFGLQECYKYNPGTIAGRFFEREDDMSVWFTNTRPYIPVKFRLNLKIGAIQGVLVDYCASCPGTAED